MTRKEVLQLHPTFTFGRTEMVEWFEFSEGEMFFGIKSGLRHADGKTKSPYYYESISFGENAEEIELDKFSNWYTSHILTL